MSKQHSQFTVDGTTYQLDSDCDYAIWPSLNDRVGKNLERIGKQTAALIVGEATVIGKTKLCHREVEFKLTINPEGIKL